ncbi:MAG: hypothetical protein ABEK50_04870 [bacterium]
MLAPNWYHVNMWLHLVAVSLWLGMTVNFSMMTMPLLRDLPRKQAEQQLTAIGHRARRYVTILMLVILATGIVNLHRVGLLTKVAGWGSAYGITAGVKVGLAMLLFVGFPVAFVVVHRYGSSDFESRINRMNQLHWAISVVTLVIMFLGVVMRG